MAPQVTRSRALPAITEQPIEKCTDGRSHLSVVGCPLLVVACRLSVVRRPFFIISLSIAGCLAATPGFLCRPFLHAHVIVTLWAPPSAQ
jgi:hypothetical protein